MVAGHWKPHSLFLDSTNYLKKKADHEAWEHDSKVRAKGTPYPFDLFGVATVREPKVDKAGDFNKRRHWLILGPPDIGKSRWVSKTFKGKSAYLRPVSNDLIFEYGVYCGQPVIIYGTELNG